MNIVVVKSEFISSGGINKDECVANLLAGKTSLALPGHFDSKGRLLGIIEALDANSNGQSRARRLLALLRENAPWAVDLPETTPLFVGSTVGEIDRIEAGETIEPSQEFAVTAGKIFGKINPVLLAGACASGHSAVIAGANAILCGKCEYALALGGDITSEFVSSGFGALGALSASECAPYDLNRSGLNLGEGAGIVLLASESAARQNNWEFEVLLRGWGESCDAEHITGPDLDGIYLEKALREALASARWESGELGGIAGHGTGTIYNDCAEIAALRRIGCEKIPLFSLKANLGHTLGATGILQLSAMSAILRRGIFPPQAQLHTPAPGAEEMVAGSQRKLNSIKSLSINIGFGGINSVLALEAKK